MTTTDHVSLKLIAMVTAQGTACTETVLAAEEDTPEQRARIEAQFCLGGWDDPIAGSWTDVTDNEECQACFEDPDV